MIGVSEDSVPLVSVVVGAHNRKQYIKSALDSVFRQTLKSELYEVIAVTNFPLDYTPPEGTAFKTFVTDDPEHEKKMAIGVENAVGRVICFLDDDDIWVNTKLQTVVDIFTNNAGVCYYHNCFKMIDEVGQMTERSTLRILQRRMKREKFLKIRGDEASFGEIRKMVKLGVNFNMSSISVSRDVIAPRIRYLKGLHGSSSNVDTFMFYSALLSGMELIADDNELTEYRIHDANTTGTFIAAGRHPDELGYKTLLQMVGDERGNRSIRRSVECMVSDVMFELYSKENVRDRHLMASAIIDHMRYFSLYDMQYDILLVLFGLLYLVSPTLGAIMHSIPEEHL